MIPSHLCECSITCITSLLVSWAFRQLLVWDGYKDCCSEYLGAYLLVGIYIFTPL